MYRLFRLGLGGLFIILGVLGLFLPVLQGILFLGIGGALLHRDIPFLARIVDRLKIRYPSISRATERLKEVFPWRS